MRLVDRADNFTNFMYGYRLSRNVGAPSSYWNIQGLSKPVEGMLCIYNIHVICSFRNFYHCIFGLDGLLSLHKLVKRYSKCVPRNRIVLRMYLTLKTLN